MALQLSLGRTSRLLRRGSPVVTRAFWRDCAGSKEQGVGEGKNLSLSSPEHVRLFAGRGTMFKNVLKVWVSPLAI